MWVIQLDRIYPKNSFKFFNILCVEALSFCNFLFIVQYFANDLAKFCIWLWRRFSPHIIKANWGTWIHCTWFQVDWHLVWTVTYEFIMLCIVTFISSMVQLYSINYMIFDDYKKFTTYISFFTFFYDCFSKCE